MSYHSPDPTAPTHRIDVDDPAFWQTAYAPWGPEPSTQHHHSFDSAQHAQHAGTGSTHADNTTSFVPSDYPAISNSTFQLQHEPAPVTMVRTAASLPGSNSVPTFDRPTHPTNACHEKPSFDNVDLVSSNNYACSPTTLLNDTMTCRSTCPRIALPPQPHLDQVQIFEPADFCSRLSSHPSLDSTAVQFAHKKQRVDSVDHGQLLSSPTPYGPNSSLPLAQDNVPPSTSTSMLLSPPSLTSSEVMSRQSSMTSVSVIDAFDMMRVESSLSTASDLFPIYNHDVDETSFVSCTTNLPASSHLPTIGLQHDSAPTLLSNVGRGSGCTTDFPFIVADHGFEVAAIDKGGQQTVNGAGVGYGHAEDMVRSDSGQSDSSISSEFRANQRRRKHLENARKIIAPKRIRDRPVSTTTTTTSENSRQSSNAQDAQLHSREAIAKAPYIRPQHPKLYCNMCHEFPGGFRGDHELRRHWDRAHADRRKVWICTEPNTRTEYRPAKPLSICKQCKQRKQYNVYYNAAAHLRRAHFCPRKRGRKARGEERESRAGKAGGDWPPIEWLKANGFLKEIEVSADQAYESAISNSSSRKSSRDEMVMPKDEVDNMMHDMNHEEGYTQNDAGYRCRAEHFAVPTYDIQDVYAPNTDFANEYCVGNAYADHSSSAPLMQHASSHLSHAGGVYFHQSF